MLNEVDFTEDRLRSWRALTPSLESVLSSTRTGFADHLRVSALAAEG
jgi:hypothetical protein